MSISNHLNKIKNAVFGKDVRGAIHDAIKQCYDDASINHDNANMEVKLARGTHDTLNDRLNKSDQNLAQTNAQLSHVQNNKVEKGELVINVKDCGAVGDGIADDADAIQTALDYALPVVSNTSIPETSVKIHFPPGVYAISKTLFLKGTAILEFNNAQLKALKVMDVIFTFRSDIQIPGVDIKNLVINGNGVAKIGLQLTDLYNARINTPIVFACTEINIDADRSVGNSGILEFQINGGLALGGINPNAGAHANCEDSIGLRLATTDCTVRDFYTRDLKTHIYNEFGVNFYDHCHAWNQCGSIMQNSVHFKIGWDANVTNCYSDTLQYAFEFYGDGRVNATNHQTFTAREFYSTEKYGAIYLFKVSGTRGNSVKFVNCRFDNNELSAKICESDEYANLITFDSCTNNYSSGAYVLDKFKTFAKPACNINVWGFHLVKPSFYTAELTLWGDIPLNTVNAKGSLIICKLPFNTFNTYYSTPIVATVEDYGTGANHVCAGVIDETGNLVVNLKSINFTASSNCKIGIVASYHITY